MGPFFVPQLFTILPIVTHNKELLDAIRKSQFTGDDTWKEYLGIESSNRLLVLCNEHNDMMNNQIYKALSSEEKLKEFLNTIEEKKREIETILSKSLDKSM